LLKRFWGWRDKQVADGTVIWALPDGHTYVTTPGSALLFPTLCPTTGDLPPPATPRPEPCGERSAMMPKRHRTAPKPGHTHRHRTPPQPNGTPSPKAFVYLGFRV